MTLDEKDNKLVEQLKNETTRWPAVRWVLSVVGVILIILGIASDEMVSAIVGVGSLAYAIQYWRGSPTATLLLRLLEHSQKTE